MHSTTLWYAAVRMQLSTIPRMLPRLSSSPLFNAFIKQNKTISTTYDHRLRKNGHPVRSAIHEILDRLISSWVGDHQRIPAVVCFAVLSVGVGDGGWGNLRTVVGCMRREVGSLC